MRLPRKSNYLVEPPAVATGDIAFNLIVFFLVCASSEPSSGRRQDIPRAETRPEQKQQIENIEVSLTRGAAAINGAPVRLAEFRGRLAALLKNKPRPEDRVVVVKSRPDTSYEHWIQVTGWIEEAGGFVTLQIEEEQTAAVD